MFRQRFILLISKLPVTGTKLPMPIDHHTLSDIQLGRGPAQLPASVATINVSTNTTKTMGQMMINRQPFNPDEHFLLADLDIVKDAPLFGYEPEEFWENVKKMKNVILTYHKWEKTDNIYKWMTRLFQVMCFFLACDMINNNHMKRMLMGGLDNYIMMSQSDIEELAMKREEDFTRAAAEIAKHPPNFSAVKKRTEDSTSKEFKSHPMDTTNQEATRLNKEASDIQAALKSMDIQQASSLEESPTSIAALRELRRILLPQSEDFTAVVKEEILDYQKEKSTTRKHPEARPLV